MEWLIVIVFSVHTFNVANDKHTRFEYEERPFVGSRTACENKATAYGTHVNTIFSGEGQKSTHGESVRLGYTRGYAQCVLRS